MFVTREPVLNLENNDIYQFYFDKYHGLVDEESFYLSGIGYIYQCIDAIVKDSGFNELCKIGNNYCTKCCGNQEAHVSLAEMYFFFENHRESLYNYIDIAIEHAQKNPKSCEDLFFIDNSCVVYNSRFFICRAYANFFRGEDYCPRHKMDVLTGKAVNDTVDCFYYFIDKLSEIDEKYYGSITPTLFFLQNYINLNFIFQKEDKIRFFGENNMDLSWQKTQKSLRYSVGLLGTAKYAQEYKECVRKNSEQLSKRDMF